MKIITIMVFISLMLVGSSLAVKRGLVEIENRCMLAEIQFNASLGR